MSSHFNVRRNKLKLELLPLDPETRTGSRTGLYYYRACVYDPELGRFMQTDPIGYYDAMNLYQYCGNNPVNWIDPWGLSGEDEQKNSLYVQAHEFWDRYGTGIVTLADAYNQKMAGGALMGVGLGTEYMSGGSSTMASVPVFVGGLVMTVDAMPKAATGIIQIALDPRDEFGNTGVTVGRLPTSTAQWTTFALALGFEADDPAVLHERVAMIENMGYKKLLKNLKDAKTAKTFLMKVADFIVGHSSDVDDFFDTVDKIKDNDK